MVEKSDIERKSSPCLRRPVCRKRSLIDSAVSTNIKELSRFGTHYFRTWCNQKSGTKKKWAKCLTSNEGLREIDREDSDTFHALNIK